MPHKKLNTLIGTLVFVLAEILYLLTMAPTFSFWDCGEFAAVAYTMSVPHPPGTPIFTMLGRVFSMLPFPSDIGARITLISTLSSALAVLFTYLITVRFIAIYRGTSPDSWTTPEKISAYAAGFVGAFALAASDSFWFNAVESEVYAFSMLFNTSVVWIIMKWYEVADEEGSDKWLMVLFYTLGLALGVHLQSLLAFFMIAMVYYYKRYEFSIQGFGILVVASSLVFFAIYPGIVKGIPAILHESIWFMIIIPLALIGAIYYTHVNKMRLANLVSMALFLIMLGYSSFTMTYLRSGVNPPINENAPNTVDKFASYLNREQYGDFPIFKRRWSQDPDHQRNYAKYSSDVDFFLRYQIGHMFGRYFGWQFIGRAGDNQDDGIDFSKLWAIPFGLGLFGMIFHFKKDWKMALSILALLILTGAFINVYANPPEPQPRERDYVYVGSYFAFAIWIGIGLDALFETLRESVKDQKQLLNGSIAICIFGVLFVNGRMLQVNYKSHDRSGNYVPYDYAYNLLNSCDKDGILFTNGDNDTFPLWYMQEVAGVRQDVRVVNLSLANTDWYVDQLKNQSPRGAKPIKFNLTDQDIKELSYEEWRARQVELPVPMKFKNDYATYDEKGQAVIDPNNPKVTPVDTIKWMFNPAINAGSRGYIRAQDRVVFEVITNNIWDRPIYFSITVGESNRIGIDNYLRMDGFGYKVVPMKSDNFGYVDTQIMYDKLMNTYKFRNLDKFPKEVYYDENTRRMVSNYKNVFLRLASEYLNNPTAKSTVKDETGKLVSLPNKELAVRVLDKIEAALPSENYKDDTDYRILQTQIRMYAIAGSLDKAKRLLPTFESQVNELQKRNGQDPTPNYLLAQTYRSVGEYQKALPILQSFIARYPQDDQLKREVAELQTLVGIGASVDSVK